MSKVICDVCGTTYPETATQCPICGSAKNSAEQTVAVGAEGVEESTSSYAYVKGGRFSKKNVRRRGRSSGAPTTAQRRSGANTRTAKEEEEPNNTGLVIVVILLLIAIAAVVVYLILPFFQGDSSEQPKETTGNTSQSTQTDPSDVIPERIPCTSIQVLPKLELGVNETWTLEVELMPMDTNDTLRFVSADPAIAAVDPDSGEITMLAEGETVITVICGTVTAECTVKTPDAVTPGPGGDDPVTPGEFNFEFNTRYKDEYGNGDATLGKQGETWKAYKTSLDIDPALITWTSDNPEIASIDKGVVTAVAPGTTKIHASYNGVTYTCIIRCTFEVREDANDCALNLNDVTIVVGQTFKLKLLDPNGIKLATTWQCDSDGVTITMEDAYVAVITGAAVGTHKVYTVYEGKTYTCIIYIR